MMSLLCVCCVQCGIPDSVKKQTLVKRRMGYIMTLMILDADVTKLGHLQEPLTTALSHTVGLRLLENGNFSHMADYKTIQYH